MYRKQWGGHVNWCLGVIGSTVYYKNLSNYYAYEVLNTLHFITKLQNFWHIYFKPISEVE